MLRFILWSADLHQGMSRRFPLSDGAEGFALRDSSDAVRAYLNRCPHRAQPVDLGDGKLFTKDGSLECQAHGALFDPANGACRGGPCFGDSLTRLSIEERAGRIYLDESEPHELIDDSG